MTQYIDIIINLYGIVGIVLMAFMLIFFFIQLRYYIGYYGVISKYRDNQRPPIRENAPTISVIVPLFTDDYPFLDERLPLIMAQEGVDFEVVLIYIGTNTDFYDDMERLQQVLPNIEITKIQSNPRFPISIKTALNVGIKAANNECMVFTSSDCYPTSDKWLALMASGFKRGDLVLGYTGVEPDGGMSRYFMRAMNMMNATMWLSRGIKGKPYRGIGTNIGWTKTLYYNSKGFSHLNMNIGEDDLFVQRLIKSNPSVSIILSPRATLSKVIWGDMDLWAEKYRYYRSSFALDPFGARMFEKCELWSRLLFAACVIAAIIIMPLEIKIAAAVLVLLRIIAVSLSIKNIAKRLGENSILAKYGIIDIVGPLYIIFVDIWLSIRREPKVWR